MQNKTTHEQADRNAHLFASLGTGEQLKLKENSVCNCHDKGEQANQVRPPRHDKLVFKRSF
jgi:hypothetical protein